MKTQYAVRLNRGATNTLLETSRCVTVVDTLCAEAGITRGKLRRLGYEGKILLSITHQGRKKEKEKSNE